MFITDLQKISKSTKDTKMCRKIDSVYDVEILQDDLKKLFQWFVDLQILSKMDKCSLNACWKIYEYAFLGGGGSNHHRGRTRLVVIIM